MFKVTEGGKGPAVRLALLVIILIVAVTMVATVPSHSGALGEDKEEAALFSPMGWTAMIFYPMAVGMKGVMKSGALIFSRDNPFSLIGDFIDLKVGQPAQELMRKKGMIEGRYPSFFIRGKSTGFLFYDLEESLNLSVEE